MNDAATRAMTTEQRFLAKVRKEPGGCWIWTARITKEGYGRFSLKGEQLGAHRVGYEMWVGPIPEGLHLDHLCRNRACVNPAHLEPVPCRVNLLRGEGFAAVNAQKTHCPHGHPYDGDNLRIAASGSRYCLECKRLKKRAWDAKQRERAA